MTLEVGRLFPTTALLKSISGTCHSFIQRFCVASLNNAFKIALSSRI